MRVTSVATILLTMAGVACTPANAGTYGRTGGSGSGATAFGTDSAFIADAVSVLGQGGVADCRYVPMDDSNKYDLTNGTCPGVRDDTYTGGVLTMPHTCTGSAYVFLKNANPSSSGQRIIANPSTQNWLVGSYTAITGTPISGTSIWLASLSSNIDDQINLKLIGATSTTVLQFFVDGTSSGSGHTSLGPTATNGCGTIGTGTCNFTAANFNRYALVFNASTGVLTALVNGNVAGTVTPGGAMPTKNMSPNLLLSAAPDMIKVAGLTWCWQHP